VLALAGCDSEPDAPPRYPFTFSAHADTAPLEGAQITVNGGPVGATNSEGVLHVDLTGPEGAAVSVNAVCPAGYRSPEEPQMQNLRRVQSLDPATARRGIEVTFDCPPERRDAVVVVRTHDQAGVPVMLDGREVARTDPSGAAHLHVAMAPGTTFQVLLDTRYNDRLRPRSPSQTFTIPDRDEVFVLDQHFEEEAPPRRHRPRARPRQRTVHLPVRIPSHR
jgi:hypothetical protein